MSPTPNTPHVFSDDDAPLSPIGGGFAEGASASLPGKITKKRKSHHDDDEDILPTAAAASATTNDIDMAVDMAMDNSSPDHHTLTSPTTTTRQRTITRVHNTATKRLKRTSSRLSRKSSTNSVNTADQPDHVVVVRPGGTVPPVPAVPSGVHGRKVKVVGDDGYGGLGHEIF